MIELIRRLAVRFPVHVACFQKSGAWLPRVVDAAASVAEFPIAGFARPGTAFQLLSFARWCRAHRVSVVQTCDFYANVFGLTGAALAGVPVRIGSRRELNPDKTVGQLRLQRQAYRCATKIVANSPAARDALLNDGIPPQSVAVIANGVEAGPAASRRSDRPRRTIITVANLRPEKNHELLLRAAVELVRRFPDLRLQLVGDGPQRAALAALAETLGLERHVEFLGHREDVPRLLAAADVFVLPSRSEALPNSVLEAMAAGLPVVAGAVGGLADVIEDGRTGALVGVDDPSALAAAVQRIIEHPLVGDTLGANAREAVIGRYSFERMATEFEALYRSQLHAVHRTAAPRTEAVGI
jgi:glycosyltransferase involved in cell wall biosynthesis